MTTVTQQSPLTSMDCQIMIAMFRNGNSNAEVFIWYCEFFSCINGDYPDADESIICQRIVDRCQYAASL